MQRILTLSLFFCLSLSVTQASAEVVDDDWKSVFKFQAQMAEYGSAKAQYILGEMYQDGRGTSRDYAKALEWYNKAKKNGHSNAAAKIKQLRTIIANARLKKKLATQKNRGKVKITKTPPTPRPVITTNKKPVANQIKLPLAKKETRQPSNKETEATAKKSRPTGRSYDLNRSKGTHIDNYEDAFE